MALFALCARLGPAQSPALAILSYYRQRPPTPKTGATHISDGTPTATSELHLLVEDHLRRCREWVGGCKHLPVNEVRRFCVYDEAGASFVLLEKVKRVGRLRVLTPQVVNGKWLDRQRPLLVRLDALDELRPPLGLDANANVQAVLGRREHAVGHCVGAAWRNGP